MYDTFYGPRIRAKQRPALPGTMCDAGRDDHPATVHWFDTDPTFGDERSLGNVCDFHLHNSPED